MDKQGFFDLHAHALFFEGFAFLITIILFGAFVYLITILFFSVFVFLGLW